MKVRRDGRRKDGRRRRVWVGSKGLQEAHDVVTQRERNAKVKEGGASSDKVRLEGRSFNPIGAEEGGASGLQEGRAGSKADTREVVRAKGGQADRRK